MKFKVTSSFYSSGTISLSIEEREAINTVLNLIAKLQKENKKYLDIISKKIIDILKDELVQLKNKELDLKDKQINLMADELVEAHEWFYSEFDNFTKEDFIAYFETKVKKGE